MKLLQRRQVGDPQLVLLPDGEVLVDPRQAHLDVVMVVDSRQVHPDVVGERLEVPHLLKGEVDQ